MLATALLTVAQKCFTISELAADWHGLMIPQHTMWPSIGRISEQLDPRFAASRHTTAQSASSCSLYATNHFPSHKR